MRRGVLEPIGGQRIDTGKERHRAVAALAKVKNSPHSGRDRLRCAARLPETVRSGQGVSAYSIRKVYSDSAPFAPLTADKRAPDCDRIMCPAQ